MLATTGDIDGVLQLYMEYLNVPADKYHGVKDGLEKFLYKHLGRDVFISCISICDRVVTMAMLSTATHLPDKEIYNHGGKYGILKNIYTVPQYRNRRFASGCINELICFANDNDIQFIQSTGDTTSLFDRLGFIKTSNTGYILNTNEE